MSASDLVVARLKEARRRRGWSAREFAEQCERAGGPKMTANMVMNIEAGRRKVGVTVDELMLFAYVCDVAPTYFLMSPEGEDAAVQITPSCTVGDRDLLRRWVRGEAPLPDTDAAVYHFTSVETLRTSDTKAAFLDRTKQIVEQFQADADAYAQRSRTQMRELLGEVEDAIRTGAPDDQVLHAIRGMSDRLEPR